MAQAQNEIPWSSMASHYPLNLAPLYPPTSNSYGISE